MKHKLAIVAGIALFILFFFSYLLPFLKAVHEQKAFFNGSENTSIANITVNGSASRIVRIDLSVESPCMNFVTGEKLKRCIGSGSCRAVCQQEGCGLFGLIFKRSVFNSSGCYCFCLEVSNVITKAG